MPTRRKPIGDIITLTFENAKTIDRINVATLGHGG
jgi:hypothetical protein